MFEQLRHEILGGDGEELFDMLSGFLELFFVAGEAGAFLLPVGDLMELGVAFAPFADSGDQGSGQGGQRDGRLVAVDATEAVIDRIPGQVGQERRIAALGEGVSEWDVDEALHPEAAFMGDLRGETVGRHEWVRHAPGASVQLPQSLGAPAGEGEIVELAKSLGVFAPQTVDRGIGMGLGISHDGGADGWGARPERAGRAVNGWRTT